MFQTHPATEINMIHRAFIGLGSNIDPERYLPAAVQELSTLGSVDAVSCVYESAAEGDASQPHYLNAAILLSTELTAEQLCGAELPAIEARLGRVRDPTNKFAARTIDLDLVLFDDVVAIVGQRRIPDPDILKRSFLAVPLAEVDGFYIHPEVGENLSVIAEQVRQHGTSLLLRGDVCLRPDSG
ncbi:MAG: 2-amino-4-hydroxy-6-hydroxymethyldihydropteridine diphosphokinase [Planctomycetaceae bacterium]|nr:2-amino-4-hydroxy-6-hydroxymethyldihydropteridine diphosphokinase [Planctomycetaceae bacterium]